MLSEVYNRLQKNDSAYFFMQRYTALKDSILNSQFMFRARPTIKQQAEFKKQLAQVALLDKDNKIKEEKLEHASEIKWILIACLLIVALSGFYYLQKPLAEGKEREIRKSKAQSELQLKATELEMQALRAQMNPHFIFNCLSSINRFILKNETEAASDYLHKIFPFDKNGINKFQQTIHQPRR